MSSSVRDLRLDGDADCGTVSAGDRPGALRPIAVVLGAALLAGCAQSAVVTGRSDLMAPRREAVVEHHRYAHVRFTRYATGAHPSGAGTDGAVGSADAGPRTQLNSQARASYYSEGGHTASGEKFDARELTAAHPTLPFGTRLRVINVATGRSVTVRVNDRGPFVRGRDVDVSYSAAQALGIVGQGVAKVKLEVEP